MVWGLKAVILSGKAPMPCYLICVFGPSDFPAAVILNFDVVFPVPSKLLHGKMATKELLVPNLLASCRNIRMIAQNQATIRCNWMRMNPADLKSLIGDSLQKVCLPH